MNFFNLTLSEKHFICPSILNDSFAGWSNLGCRSLLFITWILPASPFLLISILLRNQLTVLWEVLCRCLSPFVFSALKILSLSLISGNLITMCLGVFLLESSFFGTLWASWTSWMCISIARLGMFFFIICSNKFSISCSSSSPSDSSMIQILEL